MPVISAKRLEVGTMESSRSPCSYCGTEILRSMVNYATEFIEVKMMTPDRSQEEDRRYLRYVKICVNNSTTILITEWTGEEGSRWPFIL